MPPPRTVVIRLRDSAPPIKKAKTVIKAPSVRVKKSKAPPVAAKKSKAPPVAAKKDTAPSPAPVPADKKSSPGRPKKLVGRPKKVVKEVIKNKYRYFNLYS